MESKKTEQGSESGVTVTAASFSTTMSHLKLMKAVSVLGSIVRELVLKSEADEKGQELAQAYRDYQSLFAEAITEIEKVSPRQADGE